MTRVFRAAICAVFFILLASSSFAQLSTATLFGNVTDATGALLPNATVVLKQTDTNFVREVKTDGSGAYRAEFLPVGPYTVTITAGGFKQLVQKGIVLTGAQEAAVNFPLTTGGESTSVEVTAEVPLVNVGNSTLGATIDNHQVDNLPLVNRDTYSLLSLTPGVQQVSNENSIGVPMEHVIINGSSDNMVGQVTYYLDGGLNMTGVRNTGNVVPNPDAIDQFNVQTSNFSAQYGRTGAGVVSVLTKSGTNTVHGSVFYFHRETNFNAYSYGLSNANVKQPLHRNYFGATIGAPVLKDKVFLFGSFGGLREVSPTSYSTLVPDAAQRLGNFSENYPTNSAIVTGFGAGKGCNSPLNAANDAKVTDFGGKFFICDPITHLAIANNRADLDPNYHLDPVAQKILALNVPLPSPGRVDNKFVGTEGLPNSTNEFLAKGDLQLIPAHRLTLSYFQSNGTSVTNPSGTNLPGWAKNSYSYRQQNANVSDVWTISNRSVNQVWLNFSRMLAGRISNPGIPLSDPKYGSGITVQGTPSLADVNAGWFHLANAISGPLAGDNVYGLRDVYSTTIGKHTINAGGELYLEKDRLETLLNNYGGFTFSDSNASNVATYIRTGKAISDFLIGHPASMSQDSPDDANENYWNWGLFLQDDWRILPQLTLNLGVRYDVQTAPIDTQRRIAVFRPGQQSTVAPGAMPGQLFPGDPGVPDGGVPTNYNHFSPRVGFAFTPFANGRTVFHGGAGLFFDSISGNEWMLSQNFQPFAIRETGAFTHVSTLGPTLYSSDPSDFAGGVSPFPYIYNRANPTYPVVPASLVFVQDNMRWPYNTQVNFGIQQQFTKDFAFSVNYVGAFSRKIPLMIDNNAPQVQANAAANQLGNINCRRPFQALPVATVSTCALPTVGAKYISNAYVITDNQNTNYHGMQVTLEKRLSHHLSVNAFYIFSKSLASGSLQTTGNIGNSAATEPEDYYNLGLEKQLTDNDQRHQVNVTFVWKPDYFSGFNPIVRNVLNGWTISAITNLRSGKPFNITSGVDSNFDGDNNDRPNLVPGQIPGHISYHRVNPNINPSNQPRWFNTAAYCTIGTATCPAGVGAGGLDGAVSPNSQIGPGFKGTDAAIFRDFGIYGRVKFQFRGEATNVFNFVNLNNPNGTASSATFGQSTTAAAMRTIQLGGRILF